MSLSAWLAETALRVFTGASAQSGTINKASPDAVEAL